MSSHVFNDIIKKRCIYYPYGFMDKMDMAKLIYLNINGVIKHLLFCYDDGVETFIEIEWSEQQ